MTTHIGRAAILVLAAAAASCSSTVRQGTGTSFLIVNAMDGASGATPGTFGTPLLSDVVTVVDKLPTFFNDLGRVRLTVGLKDPGPSAAPLAPTQNQFITIERYRVRYLRADGRNTPGVDVPFGFDGALTLTVGSGEVSGAFTIVRNVAKREAPLAALATNGVVLSTIAEVTFFGRDQTGRDASVTAQMSIDFGNFGDSL